MYTVANNIGIFYEKEGEGRPLILIHGNGETHEIFKEPAEYLKHNFTCYMPDSRRHGSSAEGKLSYEDMADDMICFIEKLQIKKPVIFGFSDGGIIGLKVASKRPDMLSRLIVRGANLYPDGVKSRVKLMLKISNILDYDAKKELMLTGPHIDEKELKNITVPTLVLAGGRDVIRESHTKMIARIIPNAKCKILPGETHSSCVVNNRSIAKIIEDFCKSIF
jgi:pimeloyl-ACP methyl ester carboxylesterase